MKTVALKWPHRYLMVPFEVNNLQNIKYVTQTNNLFLLDCYINMYKELLPKVDNEIQNRFLDILLFSNKIWQKIEFIQNKT